MDIRGCSSGTLLRFLGECSLGLGVRECRPFSPAASIVPPLFPFLQSDR